MANHSRMEHGWSFALTDSLEKVYPDADPRPFDAAIPLSVLVGETASFQLAIRPPVEHGFRSFAPVTVSVAGTAAAFATLHQVDLVPVALAAFPGHDGGYDRGAPGLYPDVLRPATDGLIQPLYGHWTAAWIDVHVPTAEHAGAHDVAVAVADASGRILFGTTVRITVVAVAAPELGIVNAHWFHCDGLASHYGVPVFSEAHWDIIDRFVASAARMGANSLLTPTWTPPLDTAVGGYRLPTQLVGIHDDGGRYSFDFAPLLRWMEICARHGIKYLEIAHLFTQWGAAWTPAIYVHTLHGEERRFGWDVSATSPAYRELMAALLPALRDVLAEHWSLDRVFFHISDEPSGAEALASYQRAKAAVADLLEGVRVADALSDFGFYSSGAVTKPIVASDAVEPFLAAGVEDLWVYYCVAQDKDVANRFISMPSVRNRVLGHQLFAFGFSGFLHWGFNFYNSVHSTRPVDPFADTCAGGGFPGGDAFMVYPGPDWEPWESIRYKVFAQAMSDYRAFDLLARLAGRDAVLDLINTNGSGGRLAMDGFSYDPLHYRRVRELVNQGIAAHLNQQPIQPVALRPGPTT
ncbi:DUF4091 domain-containing protein [Pseudarthrobacter sp. P1]|uniref:DUF4091 domain-containing protein n=1 Tax=Pseudarthrobacter sp. P1 TaxID=3418418 RepID=UPI003CEB29BB